MERYNFAVLKGDETVLAAQTVTLPDPRKAWSRVAELVKDVDEPNCRVRVTNAAGGVVVLMGIAAARRAAACVAD